MTSTHSPMVDQMGKVSFASAQGALDVLVCDVNSPETRRAEDPSEYYRTDSEYCTLLDLLRFHFAADDYPRCYWPLMYLTEFFALVISDDADEADEAFNTLQQYVEERIRENIGWRTFQLSDVYQSGACIFRQRAEELRSDRVIEYGDNPNGSGHGELAIQARTAQDQAMPCRRRIDLDEISASLEDLPSEECAICMGFHMRQLTCGHLIGGSCLEQLIDSANEDAPFRCPVCQAGVETSAPLEEKEPGEVIDLDLVSATTDTAASCSVCKGTHFRKLYTCGHAALGEECLDRWLNSDNASAHRCPLCREPM